MSCEFCRDSDATMFTDSEGTPFYYDLNRKKLMYGGDELPFSHCPMCGEPLSDPQALTLEELRERDGKEKK